MQSEKRWCLWLDETCVDPAGKGFIPSRVVRDEAGHEPLTGDPTKFQTPWVFGPTIEDARRQVDEFNAKIGVTEDEAREIVLSSMFPRSNA